jgi:translation elongation factor EF-Tu-like GTPase
MTHRVLVHLKMKFEADGGQPAPFTEGYRPHFVIPPDGEYLGVVAARCPGPVGPGDEADVEFDLVYQPNVDYSALREGTEFEMHEGPRVVAIGRVKTNLG